MNIWFLNHYAIPPSLGGLNRHYYFSKYLRQAGHTVKIFTASKIHNTDINLIPGRELVREQEMDGVPYTYVRTSDYKSSGLARIWNMLQFPLNLQRACKRYPPPDIIYTSSPNPFAAAAAIRIAKRLRVPCIVEIRDLWPESIVEYQGRSRKHLAILALYRLEKWIYQKADKLIFTIEGGADYIREQGWDKDMDMQKIHHINNGVDLEEFDRNAAEHQLDDPDLHNPDTFKVIYTGSIRPVNDLALLVDTAEALQAMGEDRIQLLIYGDGSEREALEQNAKARGLDNIIFKGFVDGKYIPFVLAQADSSLIHGKQTNIMRFGSSPNKLFVYLAAGKPILSDLVCAYDIIEQYQCGYISKEQSADALANAVLHLFWMDEQERLEMGNRARTAAEAYQYPVLSPQLEAILKDTVIV